MAMVLVLEADSIYYEIDGHEILKGAYINCKQGEVVGLLGRNGCGKTTLTRLMMGLVRSDRGKIEIAGEDVTSR